MPSNTQTEVIYSSLTTDEKSTFDSFVALMNSKSLYGGAGQIVVQLSGIGIPYERALVQIPVI